MNPGHTFRPEQKTPKQKHSSSVSVSDSIDAATRRAKYPKKSRVAVRRSNPAIQLKQDPQAFRPHLTMGLAFLHLNREKKTLFRDEPLAG
jgi:hypothetical protein